MRETSEKKSRLVGHHTRARVVQRLHASSARQFFFFRKEVMSFNGSPTRATPCLVFVTPAHLDTLFDLLCVSPSPPPLSLPPSLLPPVAVTKELLRTTFTSVKRQHFVTLHHTCVGTCNFGDTFGYTSPNFANSRVGSRVICGCELPQSVRGMFSCWPFPTFSRQRPACLLASTR